MPHGFHLKVLEESPLRFAPLRVEGVKADTLMHNIIAGVLALTPKPTCRLITPSNS